MMCSGGDFGERVDALSKQAGGECVSVGGVTLDIGRCQLSVGVGGSVRLTLMEVRVLEVLMRRAGRTVTRVLLMDTLYGGMDEPEVKIIDVYASRLRSKLVLAGGTRGFIKNVWGIGYRVEVAPETVTRTFSVEQWEALQRIVGASPGAEREILGSV
jgi:DNA-binding response OmpR family regulator